MGYPIYGGFELDNDTYITQEIDGDRSSTDRIINVEGIARREGSTILANEFSGRTIVIKGQAISPTISGFRNILDDLKKNLGYPTQILQLEDERYFEATCTRVRISHRPAEITVASWEAEFVVPDFAAKGSEQTIILTVISGTSSRTDTVTISGTTFTRPVITYTAPNGITTGRTTTSGITITHVPTGTFLTWSGTNTSSPLTYSGNVVFNYQNLSILQSGTAQDFSGFFETWGVGSNQFTTTFSGSAVGGTLTFTYNPRYL